MTLSVTIGNVHILMASGHYIGQARRLGHRRWETITGKCRTAESAMANAAKKMKPYHRLRVLLIDSNPYYGPTQVFDGRCVSWGFE